MDSMVNPEPQRPRDPDGLSWQLKGIIIGALGLLVSLGLCGMAAVNNSAEAALGIIGLIGFLVSGATLGFSLLALIIMAISNAVRKN